MDTVYTLGHSTRPLDDFLALLAAHGVGQILDVRTVPKSRHNPQFAQSALERSLPAAGVAYHHLARLGGLRHARPNSANTGWRNASFRGFADYMQTPEFASGLEELEGLARERPSAILCAEAVPWRCHRSLIADALTVVGWRVLDIIGAGAPRPHRLTPFLHVVEGKLLYAEGEQPPPSGP
ncbi:MAG: DUF488 family protein [Terriglobales bacterium]